MARILICGLNGSGKSTVGKMLADRLHCRFVDVEDLYFPKTDSDYLYQSPRSEAEVKQMLLSILQAEKNIVFASVTGKYVENFDSLFQYCVALSVPRSARIERVKKRSHDQFGDRALEGGDLFEKEQAFLAFVMNRRETLVEEWLANVHVPVLRVDGEKTPDEIVEQIAAAILP